MDHMEALVQAICKALDSARIAGQEIKAIALDTTGSLSDVLREKHFLRKHGASAYYGQKMMKKRKK
jgi:ribulose kinase